MPRQGVGMQKPQSSSVVTHAIEFVELSRSLVEAVQRKDRDLASWFFNHSSASQLRRAISSVALNLAEGFGVAGGNGRLRFESALGSLNETETAIRVAIAWGYVSQAQANASLQCAKPLGARAAGLVGR